MGYLQLLFYLILNGQVLGSLSFNQFKFEKPAAPKDSFEQQEELKSTVESMNTSVLSLFERVTNLEKNGGPLAIVVQDAMRSLEEANHKSNADVRSLMESVKRLEQKVDYAQKAQKMNIESLNREHEGLETMLQDINKTIPEMASRNIALYKPTKASSSNGFGTSGPVDGSLSTSWDSGTCFASKVRDQVPWWQVDLKAFYLITQVNVTARGDVKRVNLHDLAVELFNEDPTTVQDTEPNLCYMFNERRAKRSETISLNCTEPVTGRYLRLTRRRKKRQNEFLTFCEVEVFGVPDKTST